MTVHYVFLLPALLLLWAPRSWLYFGEKARKPHRRGAIGRLANRLRRPPVSYDRSTRIVRFWAELLKKRNFLDLLRAGAGAWALVDFSFVFDSADAASLANDSTVAMITGVKAGVLLIAVAIQTVRSNEERRGHALVFVAPIYFVTGVSLGVVGFVPGALAWALIWAVSPMLFGPERLLITYTFLLGIFGPLFGGWGNVIAWMPAAAALLPVLISIFGKRPLRIAVQRTVPSSTPAK
ncbi:hypothetical protein K0B96_08540 [Horticoccus luteus]|uniref:Uncharacterized protein n=1 Tax=Horticoccus luteus TaxID=2862869 RepID=A0A8F9XLE9_9BACT|nr:hypothetical protein [Horticoccus luteus]QYM80633.1 hypothetical protein K0B96_08540 [Horticoccus luteus]